MYVVLGNRTQVIRLGIECPYLLSHLNGPCSFLTIFSALGIASFLLLGGSEFRKGELWGGLALSPIASTSEPASLLENGDKDKAHLIGWLRGFNGNTHEEERLAQSWRLVMAQQV